MEWRCNRKQDSVGRKDERENGMRRKSTRKKESSGDNEIKGMCSMEKAFGNIYRSIDMNGYEGK